jgi:anaerobic selenocysteine-containing dehydrogenase
MPEQKRQFQIYKSRGFKTKTGKFEIRSAQFQQLGFSAFPNFNSKPQDKNLAKNEVHFIPFTANVMPADMANAKWLSEISHTNAVLINPKTARQLRIQNNQKIKIKSRSGEIEAEAKYFQGIHPKAIAMKNGSGHWAFGRVAQAKKFKSDDPDSDILWWEKQGNGENPNALVDLKIDPMGKGQAWKSTIVSIHPA